jgi:hypothetical protein
MRLRSGLAIAVLLLAGACGGSETPKDEPTQDASASPSEPTEPSDLGSVVIEPGKVGPFVVGMPASEALDKGLVRQPTDDPPCPAFEATEPLQDVAVVFSSSEPKPKLLGVLVKVTGPKTPEGIGVGDSIADLKAAYGDQLRLEEGDFGEKVFRIYEGDRAMGFTSSEGTKPRMKIDAIEVFAKSDPVIWDGC